MARIPFPVRDHLRSNLRSICGLEIICGFVCTLLKSPFSNADVMMTQSIDGSSTLHMSLQDTSRFRICFRVHRRNDPKTIVKPKTFVPFYLKIPSNAVRIPDQRIYRALLLETDTVSPFHFPFQCLLIRYCFCCHYTRLSEKFSV